MIFKVVDWHGAKLHTTFPRLTPPEKATWRAAYGEENAAFRSANLSDEANLDVRQILGDPSDKSTTGRGEIWVYGNQRAMRMTPYAGPWVAA